MRPRPNMGYLSGQDQMEGTARGDRAPLRHRGAALWGPWVGEPKPQGKTPWRGKPSPDMTYLPTYCPRLGRFE